MVRLEREDLQGLLQTPAERVKRARYPTWFTRSSFLAFQTIMGGQRATLTRG